MGLSSDVLGVQAVLIIHAADGYKAVGCKLQQRLSPNGLSCTLMQIQSEC